MSEKADVVEMRQEISQEFQGVKLYYNRLVQASETISSTVADFYKEILLELRREKPNRLSYSVYNITMFEKLMQADFLAKIKAVVDDASRNISKRVIIKDLSKQIRDGVKNYNVVFLHHLYGVGVLDNSGSDFDDNLTEEALSRIFQLYVIPEADKMMTELLYDNFPHVQSPRHRNEHCLNCGGFHSMWDCPTSLEEAEENWKVTRMGHWDGEASYLPYLKLLKNGTETETSDSKTSSRKKKPKSKYWKKSLEIESDKSQF